MSSNLREKTLNLVDDIEKLDRMAKARTVQRFIESELALLQEEKYLDQFDILHIQSKAQDIFSNQVISMDEGPDGFALNPAFARAVVVIQATVGLLRAKGILPHVVAYRRNKQALKSICDHKNAYRIDPQAKINAFRCPECAQVVKAVYFTTQLPPQA